MGAYASFAENQVTDSRGFGMWLWCYPSQNTLFANSILSSGSTSANIQIENYADSNNVQNNLCRKDPAGTAYGIRILCAFR